MMVIFAKLIGMIILGMGLTVLIVPQWMKRMLDFWLSGQRVYGAAVIRLLIGIVLLLAASESRIPGAVVALGIFVLLSGVLIFVLGIEKTKAMIQFWDGLPVVVYRIAALLVISFGILILNVV